MAVEVIARAEEEGQSCLVVVHRQELMIQFQASLSRRGRRTEVVMLAEMVKRLDKGRPCDLAVVDEAHHAAAKQWTMCLNALKAVGVKILGLSATPERLDGSPLTPLFKCLVQTPQIGGLIEMGHLVPGRILLPAIVKIASKGREFSLRKAGEQLSRELALGLRNIGADYRQYIAPSPAIVFCCGVPHARATAEKFSQEGLRSAVVSGKEPKEKRLEVARRIQEGELDLVCNCDLWTEGVDIPCLGGCVMLRPTKSLALFLQMVGRVLRPYQDKKEAIVLDYVGNVFTHGLPAQDRDWSLEGRPRHRGGSTVKTCPKCFAAIPRSVDKCSYCHHRFVTAQKSRKIQDCCVGDFVEVTGDPGTPIIEALSQMADSEVVSIFSKSRSLLLIHAAARRLGKTARQAYAAWRRNCRVHVARRPQHGH